MLCVHTVVLHRKLGPVACSASYNLAPLLFTKQYGLCVFFRFVLVFSYFRSFLQGQAGPRAPSLILLQVGSSLKPQIPSDTNGHAVVEC